MPAREGRNVTERCPDWAVPSRAVAWRLVCAGCLLFWSLVILLVV
jgi:hypothetical protein